MDPAPDTPGYPGLLKVAAERSPQQGPARVDKELALRERRVANVMNFGLRLLAS